MFEKNNTIIDTHIDTKQELIDNMTALGTYTEEFNQVIEVTAKTIDDYYAALQEFDESGGNITIEYTNKLGATNIVKNPCYVAIENLRSQMLLYLREIGLTPAGLKKINDNLNKNEEKSRLETALAALSK